MKPRYVIASTLAVLAGPLVAQNSLPAPSAPEHDIIVTGVSLKTSEARLAECLARKCPPKEDIDASLSYAENAFVAGDYKLSRRTLKASIGRNKRYAKELPIDVSDLLRAQSRVASHLGEKQSFLLGSIDAADTLKAGLQRGDPRTMAARIEIGDSMVRGGDPWGSIYMYQYVLKKARKYKSSVTEGYVQLRVANLYVALARQDRTYKETAKNELKTLANNTDPAFARFAAAAKVMLAGLSADDGDTSAVDKLADQFKNDGASVPVLLYAPSILPVNANFKPRSSSDLSRIQMDNVDDQWVDVGFRIGTDGKVSDVDVLRQSPSLSGNWVNWVTSALKNRRYTAFTPTSGRDRVHRVERYTLTANWNLGTGSNIRVRGTEKRIEMLDLTL